MSKVQISEELFFALCKYHLAGVEVPEDLNLIKSELEDKMNRIVSREQYRREHFYTPAERRSEK